MIAQMKEDLSHVAGAHRIALLRRLNHIGGNRRFALSLDDGFPRHQLAVHLPAALVHTRIHPRRILLQDPLHDAVSLGHRREIKIRHLPQSGYRQRYFPLGLLCRRRTGGCRSAQQGCPHAQRQLGKLKYRQRPLFFGFLQKLAEFALLRHAPKLKPVGKQGIHRRFPLMQRAAPGRVEARRKPLLPPGSANDNCR